jgi:hypothetical protein
MCMSEALTKFQTEINEEFVGWEFKMEKKSQSHERRLFWSRSTTRSLI